MEKPFTFRRFFLRSWIWNIIVSAIFACMVLVFWNTIFGFHGDRSLFFIIMITALLSGVHGLLLVVFCIRRLIMKHWLAAGIYLVHGILGALLSYYLFGLWLLSMTGAFKQ
jgi:hypothetical protein